jgi:hypothetical protein
MTDIRHFSLTLAAALGLAAAAAAQSGFPFQNETLHYTVNSPGGLSLGDATLTAGKTSTGWDFTVTLDAGVPGFAIKDRYTSSMTGYCSSELKREIVHGGRTTRETTTFDQQNGTAHRVTEFPKDGGFSDMTTGPCGRDAIAFLYFARKELGQGRMPPAQTVYFGSAYSVRQNYTGPQTIAVGDKSPEVTDHVVFSVKGPVAEFTVEVYYRRDAARTPLLIKIPQTAGTLSLELVR